MGCGGSTEEPEPVAPPPQANRPNRPSPEEQAKRDAERKYVCMGGRDDPVGAGELTRGDDRKRQEAEDRMMQLVQQERPPPFQLGPAPNISDEDAYKEYMRKKLVYQEWENSCLREAMKRIKEEGGG